MQVQVGQCNSMNGNVGAKMMNLFHEHEEMTLITDLV